MNFELTPQQKAVQQSARQFAQTVLQETVLEDDAAGRFPEEAEALEAIIKAGYEIEFALIKEASIGTWDKFRGQFGFN